MEPESSLTRVCRLHLSSAKSLQSTPFQTLSWIASFVLFSRLRLGLPSGLFPSDFPTKTPQARLLTPISDTYPAHPILIDLIIWIIFREYRSWSSSVRKFFKSPVTSPLLGPNTYLSALSLFTLNLLSSFNIGDQVSHSYKTTYKIIFLWIGKSKQTSCLSKYYSLLIYDNNWCIIQRR